PQVQNPMIHQSQILAQSSTTVHVYVIDTGIKFSHQEFNVNRATKAFDAVDDDNNPVTDSNTDRGVDSQGQPLDGVDTIGHGTHVAAIIGGTTIGLAPSVSLHAVRVFRDDPLSTPPATAISELTLGINWVAGHHLNPAVANMSFETDATQDTPAIDM